MPSSRLILCRPLLLLPPTAPSTRVFSSELTLRRRWPKYWSFSFSIISSKEIPELTSFRMDWLDLLAVQGTLKSLLQHHSSKASILWRSAFFTVQLSHPYVTTGKTIALTRWTFVVLPPETQWGRGRSWLLAPPPARDPVGVGRSWLLLPPETSGEGAELAPGSFSCQRPSGEGAEMASGSSSRQSSLPFDLQTFWWLSHSGSKLNAGQMALKPLFLLRVTYSGQNARTEGRLFCWSPESPSALGQHLPYSTGVWWRCTGFAAV